MDNSFQQLRRAKGLTSREIADAAGVSLAEEYLFEIGGIINKEARQKVMQAFQKLTGTIPEQPTTIMNTLGGPHAAPTGQDRTNRKSLPHQDYD